MRRKKIISVRMDRGHWVPGVSDGLTLPCSRCGEVPKFDYLVDDEFWRTAITNREESLGVVCLPCLDKLARKANLDLTNHLLSIQFTGLGITIELKPETAYYYEVEERRKTVYLGGGIGTWRKGIEKRFPNVKFIDPFRDSDQKNICSFTTDDINAIAESDICFFLINYPVYTGSCVEIGIASTLGKPIIVVFLLKGRVDPLIIGLSKGMYTDLKPAIDRLKRMLEG